MTFPPIDSAKQTELIELFEGLPPTECLPVKPSEAQIERWHEIKRNWTVLKMALENFFSGRYILEDIPIKKGDTAHFELIVRRYLKLYELLNWGWRDIENFYAGIEIPASNPGQAFAYILEEKAACEFLDE